MSNIYQVMGFVFLVTVKVPTYQGYEPCNKNIRVPIKSFISISLNDINEAMRKLNQEYIRKNRYLSSVH